MWHKGLWAQPTLVWHGLALARVEYKMLPEPKHVVEFRKQHNGVEHLTWVPQDNQPAQELFMRRRWVRELSVFELELVAWDRLENVVRTMHLNATEIATMMKVLADASGADKRRGAMIRQEHRRAESRTALDADGKPAWYSDNGTWYKEETAYNKFKRESKGEARLTKGLAPGKGDNETETKNEDDAHR